jgi:hypothetical protein
MLDPTFPPGTDDDRGMSFKAWCRLNGFSENTGRRLRARGEGPRFLRISERIEIVTVGENRRWQQSRVKEIA